MKSLKHKRVFLMAGYPGSGKSTLAHRLAEKLTAHYLSSDGIREQIFQSSRYDQRGDAFVSTHRDQVYHLIGQMVVDELTNHDKIIVDATNLEIQKREALLTALTSQLSPHEICFVCVKTPFRQIRDRMKAVSDRSDHTKNQETLFEAWQRVYAIFREKKKQGLLSWPQHEQIQNISAKRMYAYLDATN